MLILCWLLVISLCFVHTSIIVYILHIFLCLAYYHFFFNDTATTEIDTYCHTLSLHDALPISDGTLVTLDPRFRGRTILFHAEAGRSEEHTSELQSLMRISYAVFCLKKKK